MPQRCTGCSMARLVASLMITALLGSACAATVLPSGSLRPAAQPQSAQVTPEPGMMFDPTDRLAPPPMSDPPTQVEQGRYAFYLSCMVCHGDQGQGLTEEWRAALDPADQNCWQSKCHAANHPPEGFELPRYAPPVIGPGRLSQHQTAAGLYAYIRARMPWQAPGVLSDEAYWQLTAFLMDANGIPLGDTPLGPANAADVRLSAQPAPSRQSAASGKGPAIWPPLVVGVTVLMLGLLTVHRRRRAR